MKMNKKTKRNILALLGIGAAGGLLYYFTTPKQTNAIIPTTPAPNQPGYIPPTPPAESTPSYVPTPTPAAFPVIKGFRAKVGDKLFASVAPATVYKNVNPGTPTDQIIPAGNYAGQVIDTSPAAFIKVRMYTGAPYYDGSTHTEFYLSKARLFTVRN